MIQTSYRLIPLRIYPTPCGYVLRQLEAYQDGTFVATEGAAPPPSSAHNP